jgi:hypothetical protein
MRSLTKPFVSLLTLGLGLLAFAAPAAAESYGYLRVVEGSATLMQAGTDERSSAEINQPVLAGDRVWVPDRSRVEIVLADRNILRIDGGSELILERLAGSPDRDDRATVVRLLEGNIQLAVVEESLGDELPRIETPSATVYVEDYGIFRVTAEREGWSEVVVRRGSAQVVTEGGSSRIRADEEAVIEGDRHARVEVREAGRFDSLETWARRLDDEYESADMRYVDDNLRYQAAPLNRYGSWVTIEGGNYWRPRVASDWRPYWQGRWIYTPAGLTWVSSEPWGWVPYHYGSWDYFPSHGWVWAPGYRWSPAWVYWYWGADHVGWCPTGYYTRYYGSRWGGGLGFRYGVYGWAGGSWDHFDRWSFVRSGYFGGYNHGYRNGYRDGYWDGRQDVHRYAVPRGQGTLGRGIITTDTKPLKPSTWGKNPEEVLRGMRTRPDQLQDVTTFVARKPDLSDDVRRTLVAAGDTKPLDGTPLKPSTLGRKPTRDDSWNEGKPGKPRVTLGDGGPSRGGQPTVREVPDRSVRPAPQADGGAAKPRFTPGEQPDRSGRPSVDTSKPSGKPSADESRPTVRERPTRPAPEADGGSPRPERPSRVEIDSKPVDKPSRPADRPTVNEPTVRERPSRPAPEADGGSPRPERSTRPDTAKPREVRPPSSSYRSDDSYDRGSVNRQPSVRERESEREPVVVRPERYERPSDRYERPQPRVYEQPRDSRPAPTYDRERESSRPTYSRPEPRQESRPEPRPTPQVERERSRSTPSVRQSEPPRSRGSESSRPQVRERSSRSRGNGRGQ